MTNPLIDLRSDTVTRPTPAMRAVMAAAEVGDDVFGDDPSVRALERRTAELLGKEAALYVPTGTMANQLAVAVHAGPGDELICDEATHVYAMEGGAIARLSGVTARPLCCQLGLLTPAMLAGKVRPDDPHFVRTKLVWLENTHNRGGGRVHPLEDVKAISRWAREHKLALHLDGAPPHERGRRDGNPRLGMGPACRHRLNLFFQGTGSPGRFSSRRHGRDDSRGAPRSQSVRRRDAPGGRDRRGGALRTQQPRRTASRRPS